jgi:hypothetical protein
MKSEIATTYLVSDGLTWEADTRLGAGAASGREGLRTWVTFRIRTLGLSASGVLLFVDVVLVAPTTMASAGLRTAPRARIIQSSTLALRRPLLGARLLSTRTAPVRDALRPARSTG